VNPLECLCRIPRCENIVAEAKEITVALNRSETALPHGLAGHEADKQMYLEIRTPRAMRMTIPSLLQGKSLGLQAWSYAVLVTIIPALLWLLLIQRFGLPVLYADDWGFMPFILKLREGSLHFADYWAPHGPHPLIVTRAFFALFFRSGPLDPRPIMFCSWLLATGAVIVANRYLIWPRVTKHPASLKVLAGLAFSVWALSLVQFESQLWGFEIAFIATLCCALLGASVLAIERCRLSIRVAALLLVGGAGALTSGQGVMLLPALAVGCLFCARSRRQAALVAGVFLVGIAFTMWFYHHDHFDSAGWHALFGWFSLRPRLALAGVLGTLGSPLTYIRGTHRVDAAPSEGLFILLIFAGLLFLAIKRRNVLISAPFIALGIYSLLYAILVTAGRATAEYTDWFLTSRYTTSALCIYFAVLGLCLVNFAGARRSAQFALGALLVGFIGLGLGNSTAAAVLAKEEYLMRRASMRLLDYQSLFHSELDGVWTGPFFPLCPLGYVGVVATGVNPARTAGLIPPQKRVSIAPGISGSWDWERGHKVTYLNHLYWAETLSGNLHAGETFDPDLVLVRRVGDPLFSTFGLVSGNHWRIVLGPEVAKLVQDPVEVFAFETTTGRLAQIAR
jgi:hypothetical protein